MYACMCVITHVHVYVYICMCVRMYVCFYMYVGMRMPGCMAVCMYV